VAKKKRITEKMKKKAQQHETFVDGQREKKSKDEGISRGEFDKYQGLFLAILIAAGFFVYSNTFNSPFVFDDIETITKNRFIRMVEFSGRSIGDAAFGGYARNRPIPMVSFALNYYFGQYNAIGYHLINIIIHIVNALLLYAFLKITLKISNQKNLTNSRLSPCIITAIAYCAAFIWLVHPLQSQSVTYVVQRMNSMAAMFYLLSLLLYVRGRMSVKRMGWLETRNSQLATRNRQPTTRKHYFWFIGCGLAGILALGSKESTATLPFFIFFYEWYFFQDLSKRWLKKHLKYAAAIAILFGVVAFIYLGFEPWTKVKNLRDFSYGQFTVSERLLTQARVVIYYVSLLFYPHPSRLNLDYDFPLSRSLVEPAATLFSLFALIGLVGVALYLAKRDRVLSFCIFWFLGTLIIESSVIPLAIIFEHRTYLPSMLVSLMAVTLVFRHIRVIWVRAVALFGVVMLFSVWVYERNKAWSDDVTLWRDCAEKSPQKARPHNNLGLALAGRGSFAEAISYYTEALRLRPDFAEAHNNLGNALLDTGKIEEAISQYTETLRIKPGYVEAHNNLGNALLSRGSLEEAAHHFSEALRLRPDFTEAHNNLGNAFLRQGNVEEAFRHYKEALRLNPHYAETHYNLGIVLLRRENLKKATHHFIEALKIKPDYAKAHSDLGIALSRQGRPAKAIHHFTEALRVDPSNEETHYNLGVAWASQGKLEEAIRHFLRALEIKPKYAEAYYNLANALLRQGRIQEAMNGYNEALRLKPNFVEAHCNIGAVFLSQGKPDEAINHYLAALQIKPGFVEAHYNLGNALVEKGRVKEAMHHYREAVRVDPKHRRAKEKLDALVQDLTTEKAP